MERYIEQLIEDLRMAGASQQASINMLYDEEDDEEERFRKDMEEVEKFVYGEQIPMEEITGIAVSLFPPSDKLSEDQKVILVEELEALLERFHFVVEFPEGFPLKDRYPFILKIWDDKYVEMKGGTNHIELCSYDPDNCPFPDYCTTCKDIAESYSEDEDSLEEE